MPIDETKLNALKAKADRGETIYCAEILSVYWSDSVTVHYASRQFDDITPHRNVSLKPIEARLLNNKFHAFEMNPDIRTETISFTFENSDKNISDKFKLYGEGVGCELFYYFADVDLLVSMWFGQLQKPNNADYQELKVQATNGRFSSEMMLPSRFHETTCSFNFGGLLTDVSQLETNGCPYDRQLGGSFGNLNGGVPFTSCDKTEADCLARLGSSKYHGGFNADVNSVVTDTGTGYAGKPKTTKLKTPVPLVYGRKHIRPQMLYFRKELPDWVRMVFEIGEGPIEATYAVVILTKFIESQHIVVRRGDIGQPKLPLWSNIREFSGTGVFTAAHGIADHRNTSPSSIDCLLAVHGFNKAAVYTDSETYTRIWSNLRAWLILELYTNQKFGLRQDHSRFDIDSFKTAAEWGAEFVRFTLGTKTYDHLRDYCDVFLKGETASNVISSICEQGRLSIPFQHDGKYMVTPFRVFTETELDDAPVFYDRGENRNIDRENGMPTLRVTEKSDLELVNTIKLTFEDENDLDNPRPITCEDVQQKQRAGRAMGINIHPVVKDFSAYSVRALNQAIKLGYGLLWFGNGETVGTKNNLEITFRTDLLEVLNLRRWQPIKLVSTEIDGYEYDGYQFEYFVVRNMRKDADNRVTVTAFAYNKEAMEAFETEPPEPNPNPNPTEPTPLPMPQEPCMPTFDVIDQADGYITVNVIPC